MKPSSYLELPDAADASEQDSQVPLPEGARRVAVIDLGSNSLRLLVSQVGGDGRIQVLNCVKSMVRLGEGAFENQALQPQAIERTISVLKTFARTCRSYGVSKVVAVATASVREAENGKEFTERVKAETGIDFSVISGPEEARLITMGVEASLPRADYPRAYMDIGGGSTEFSVSREGELLAAESLRVGCVRLADLFFRDFPDAVPKAKFREVQDYVRDKSVMPFKRLLAKKPRELIASSGTAGAIASLALSMRTAEQTSVSSDTTVITIDEVRAVVDKICSSTAAERAALPGMNQKRVGVIIPGAAIFLTAMEELGFNQISITDRGLRNGVLIQYLETEGLIPGRAVESKQRGHAVKSLAKTFQIDVRHAKQVSFLSRSLFSQARELGLTDLPKEWGALLGYASWLQETGISISYLRQRQHSAYIVANSDLLGFTQRETHLLAAIIYSSKYYGKSHPFFIRLSDDDWKKAAQAGIFLRLAVGLDKSHRSAVTGVTLQRSEKGLTVRVESDSPSPIERDCLERMAKSIAKALNSPIEILWTDPIGGEVKDGVPETAIKAWRRKKANRKKKSKLKKAKNKLKKKHHKK